MAVSKKKQIKQKEVPKGKVIAQGGDPGQYYSQCPAWAFHDLDDGRWSFAQKHAKELFWTEILPRLKDWEVQTWNEILVKAKKMNHPIDVNDLNKTARDRLAERHIEAEALISLRLQGTHRLYGYMTGATFNILWFDDDHGDNDTCVCRSYLKHT